MLELELQDALLPKVDDRLVVQLVVVFFQAWQPFKAGGAVVEFRYGKVGTNPKVLYVGSPNFPRKVGTRH